MIPDFLKKLLGKGGDVATAPKPGIESLAAPIDAGITPKPTLATPFPDTYANPMESMASTPAPALALPPQPNDPRMAGRTIADEFRQRQSDPNPEVVFREPFGAQKYDYVTNGGTELPHRSWKEALKNIATGAMVGMANGQGIGGAIGGAAAGGIGGAIDPVAGKSLRFNSFQLPKLAQNRDDQNQQAMTQAKIGAENAKAQQEMATAQSRGLIKTDRGLFNARANSIIPGTEPDTENQIRVLPPQAMLLRGATPIVTNTAAPRASNQIFKAVKNVGGRPTTMLSNDARFDKYPDYEKPAGGLTPAQQLAQSNRDAAAEDKFNQGESEYQDAVAAFENAKQDALKRGISLAKVKDDEDVKAAMTYLKQNYPRRTEVGLGDQGVPYVKERGDYKPVKPTKSGGKPSGSGINLRNPNVTNW